MKKTTCGVKSFLHPSLLILATSLLYACGGSSDDDINVETLNASLSEDTQFQQSISFTDTPLVITNASNGSVSVSSADITYTPNADFNGSDSAVIEAGNTRYNFSFIVTPVNDLPVISDSQIFVTASEEISGQLSAADVDGDTVTFSLAVEPDNGSLTVNENGAFTYIPDEFALPIDSFTVTLNDGSESTTAAIELRPSFASNEDKRAYYYRSSISHLRQASDILTNINDDIATEDAYIALAIGYENAGLQNQLDDVLENNLTTQQAAANAQRRLGNFALAQGNNNRAVAYFTEALQTYAQFLADNGIDNISNNDASFIQGLSNNARVLQNEQLSNAVQQQLDLYLQELGGIDNEYTTPYGRFVTAFRFEVQDLIAQYQVNRNDDNLARALASIDQFVAIVRDTGYQEVRRGDNAGERYFRLAPLYNAEAVGYYYDIGQLDKARDQLAFTFAYYSEVSYDSLRARAALPYADITRAEYTFPLIDVAYYFALLYPDENTSLISNLVDPTDIFADDIENAIADASAINIVLQGGSVTEAIAQVETLYQGDLRDKVERLTNRGIGSTPYFGETLLNSGQTEQAIAAFDRALEILSSEAYLLDNTRSTLYATGSRGCLRFVDFYLRVDDANRAANAAATCEQIQVDYFSESNSDQLDVAEAHIDLIDAYSFIQNTAKVEEIAGALDNYLASTYTRSDVFEIKAQIPVIYFANGNNTAALTSLQSLSDGLAGNNFADFEEEAEIYIEVLKAVSGFDFEDNSLLGRPAMAISLRGQFNATTYADHLSQFNTVVSELSASLRTVSLSLAVSELSGLYEDIIDVLSASRQYDAVRTLISELGLTGEEAIVANASLANGLALQDDFPSSDVASVDTDGDGLANFFAPNLSDEQIKNSGISADDDSDNDGIADVEDPTPLGINAQ